MPTRIELTTDPVRPWKLMLLALATTFIGEYLIMRILPLILPRNSNGTLEAMADACLLTLLVAPVLWTVAVGPLQKLAQSRMHFLRRALTSQEEERQRITRELHDGVGQSLTSMMLSLRALEETTNDPRVREQIQSLRNMGSGIHDDLRRVVQGLRPAILDQLGLVAATQRLLEEFQGKCGSPIELSTTGFSGSRLNAALESTAFRIIQEAISNAVKHANATQIQVSLIIEDDTLTLRISDNGQGFEEAADRGAGVDGYGLVSIRERAMIAGGMADILTTTGKGTTVTARLPVLLRNADRE